MFFILILFERGYTRKWKFQMCISHFIMTLIILSRINDIQKTVWQESKYRREKV